MNIPDWPQDVKDTAHAACNRMFSGHREMYFDDICRVIMDERERCAALIESDKLMTELARESILRAIRATP